MTPFSRCFGIALVISTVAALGCKAAPLDRNINMGPVSTGPGTLSAARQYLAGHWTLMSFEVYPPGQQPIVVEGSGTLIYDDYGNLTMELHTTPPTAQRLAKVGIVMEGTTLASKGRTIVDLQNKKLTYEIEGQPQIGEPSGPLALNRPRYWEVNADVLTLTTKDANGAVLSSGKWKKVQ